MNESREDSRARLAARLAEMKQTRGSRRRRGELILRCGLIAMLLLPAGFGYFAYLFTADAWLAVSDARPVAGTVREVEQISTTYRENNTTKTSTSYIVHVTFRGDGGREMVRPLQHGGATDDDTRFARDILDIGDYPVGTEVALLYHPEREHRVWLDDFRALWILPLIMGGAALVAGFLVAGGLVVLWPRTW
ncbi:MAG: DUF3592 domain-containing protein [Alphaproteobacteria bacterium]